jgi:PAS domain S-box-containing protein
MMLKKLLKFAKPPVFKADESTRKSESLALRAAIFESALECIVMIDHRGWIIEFNPAAEAVFGFTRADVLGKNIADVIIPPSFRDQHRRGLAKYLATGEGPVLGKRVELTGMRADGTQFPVELVVTPISGEVPPVFIGFLRDITELKHTGEALKQRAAQFEALAQVTQAITSIRDLKELLPHITSVISEKFGFYHVGIFLMDEVNEYAVLSAANSEGGRKMLERRHRLRVGAEGIVGNVTSTGEPRIAMDVGQDPVFFNNPELPDTHSEMALPLKSEGRIVGALDVQSTERGVFSDEDVQMLSLLASQVSLAIENARLFDETRSALAEAEIVTRQFTREAWGRLPTEQHLIGYRYNLTGASPLEKHVPLAEPGKQNEADQVVVPIELRGETIGTLIVQSLSTDGLNQDQIDLIKAVAERVALSAENARLFEETTRRAERERLVSDITGKIRSVNDPQSMIRMAMEELRKALGASRVEVIPQAVKGGE